MITRRSFRYCESGNLYDHHGIGSALIGVIDHRSDHQYLSDGDIHTGTDPYVCAEDSCRVCRNDDFWFLDADTANRVYYRFVVEFRRILKLSGYGKFEFFFSYI